MSVSGVTEARRPRRIEGHGIAELHRTPSAEQNMGMPVTMPRRWTVDEVHALQEQDPPHRYEVVDGELLVSPGPRLSHQRAVFLMARLLGAYVEAWQIGEVSGGPGVRRSWRGHSTGCRCPSANRSNWIFQSSFPVSWVPGEMAEGTTARTAALYIWRLTGVLARVKPAAP